MDRVRKMRRARLKTISPKITERRLYCGYMLFNFPVGNGDPNEGSSG